MDYSTLSGLSGELSTENYIFSENATIPDHNFTSANYAHAASNLIEALNIMSASNKNYVILPVEENLFNFNLKVEINQDLIRNDDSTDNINESYSYNAAIKIFDLGKGNGEFIQFLTNIGNNDEISVKLGLELFNTCSKIDSAVKGNYQTTYKILARRGLEVNWHKDRNDCEIYDHPEYNIGIALTSPVTWFCKASEIERFEYDNIKFNSEELETKCINKLLYEVPPSSAAIFRAYDNYAAIHSNPFADY